MALIFKPYDLAAVAETAPYFRMQTDRFCDWTAGATYMWRQHFDCRYTIVADCLVLQARYTDGQMYFLHPLGHDIDDALTALEQHCAETGAPLQFSTVSPADTARLQARYGEDTAVVPMRDFYDYLYNFDDLATFAGRRYSGQRNHINQFIKKWPDWQYHPLTPQDVPAVLDFLEELVERKSAQEPLSPTEQADADGSRELLAVMHDMGMTGGFLTVEGAIVAFSVGEVLGDTLYVHIEKGDLRYGGVYQLMVREYAAHSATPDVRFINREDDSGDPGLRRSKLAYHPCAILEKNLVIPPTERT